jgi:hypothetical protein
MENKKHTDSAGSASGATLFGMTHFAPSASCSAMSAASGIPYGSPWSGAWNPINMLPPQSMAVPDCGVASATEMTGAVPAARPEMQRNDYYGGAVDTAQYLPRGKSKKK